MENQDRPNLFQYATSELSQDAFICWLAAWANPLFKAADADLHEIGQQFVLSMIRKEKADYHQSTLKTVKVSRQVGKLDVLIEVNKKLPDQLAILVEDKTHTSNHSDQLNRYYGQVKELGYTENQMIPLYFKTGYQSRFDTLGVFKPYLRKDFLSVLRENKRKTGNAVFHDFLDHLESLESAIQQFSAKELDQWYGNDWPGFYMQLYKSLEPIGANWGHIHNKSGGFIGFWWYVLKILLLLIFTNLICKLKPFIITKPIVLILLAELKTSVEDKSTAKTAWYDARERLKASQSPVMPINIAKLSTGFWMTVARWQGEYRVMTDGKLDMAATLENLKKAQQLLDKAFP